MQYDLNYPQLLGIPENLRSLGWSLASGADLAWLLECKNCKTGAFVAPFRVPDKLGDGYIANLA